MSTYPTADGAAAVRAVQSTVTPRQLLGCRVALASRKGYVYHGTLEAVADNDDLTISVRDGYEFKRFTVAASDVKSCKLIHFERNTKR